MKIPLLSFLLKKSFSSNFKNETVLVAGLPFKNKLGLAAGFDKDGKYLDLLAQLGFGHIEVGTVTPKPQKGNSKPRLFRLVEEQAIINRMGFNNDGVDALVLRLINFKNKNNIIIGGNIGQNKDTPPSEAAEDYVNCFKKLAGHVDYFTINVSSPNTPGLRALQEKKPLDVLLTALQKENALLEKTKPLFLKISPDISLEAADDIIEVVLQNKIHGIIISNTTISRPVMQNTVHYAESGGLSGTPLKPLAINLLIYFRKKLPQEMVLIGVGGIMTADDAVERINADCQLIQIYSGMIFNGPWLPKAILNRLK